MIGQYRTSHHSLVPGVSPLQAELFDDSARLPARAKGMFHLRTLSVPFSPAENGILSRASVCLSRVKKRFVEKGIAGDSQNVDFKLAEKVLNSLPSRKLHEQREFSRLAQDFFLFAKLYDYVKHEGPALITHEVLSEIRDSKKSHDASIKRAVGDVKNWKRIRDVFGRSLESYAKEKLNGASDILARKERSLSYHEAISEQLGPLQNLLQEYSKSKNDKDAAVLDEVRAAKGGRPVVMVRYHSEAGAMRKLLGNSAFVCTSTVFVPNGIPYPLVILYSNFPEIPKQMEQEGRIAGLQPCEVVSLSRSN